MIAVDTNVLVYAHRADAEWHERAVACVRELAEGTGVWGIPWPCVHEFVAIVTHPRIFRPPTPAAQAAEQVDAWLASPSLTMLGESEGYWAVLRAVLETSRVVGPRVHDARIAAICEHNGVRELWSADRDFQRFPAVKVRNPLV